MDEEPSEGSGWGNVLYAAFAILALMGGIAVNLAMVLTFGG